MFASCNISSATFVDLVRSDLCRLRTTFLNTRVDSDSQDEMKAK